MTCRKGLSPEEIANLLRELSENESDGEQARQTKRQWEETQRKQDLSLHERIQNDDRRENSLKIPYRANSVRDDLKNTYEKYSCKNYEDNLKLCDEALGQQIGAAKARSDREEKLRQLLWETAPELRELRKQMLMADVAKDQAMQVAEKRALTELRRQEEESLAAAVQEEERQHQEEQRRIERLEHQAKLKYHKDLDDLRQFKASKQDKEVEQVRREMAAIDDIKRKIEEEDQKLARTKMEAQKELLRQAIELQKVREEMQLLEKQKEKALEVQADEYRKAQELRAKQLEEERQLISEQRLQLQEELLTCLERMYAEKAKQELLWTELSIEEREVWEKEKRMAAEKRQRILKEEMQQLYDMQMYVKKQKEELQKKEEELFRQNLMSQLYEEQKLEHMSQQKRRIKQIEHRRIAQELIEQNRKKKEIERARERADFELLKDQETERLRLVEEERKKFLGEHAKELLGYLPKRVFRDKQEIERLGEEFKNFYSRKNCSTLYQENK